MVPSAQLPVGGETRVVSTPGHMEGAAGSHRCFDGTAKFSGGWCEQLEKGFHAISLLTFPQGAVPLPLCLTFPGQVGWLNELLKAPAAMLRCSSAQNAGSGWPWQGGCISPC